MTSLRDRLRADTRPLHDRVDAATGALDLRAGPSLALFLRRQLLAMGPVRPEGAEAEAARALLGRQRAALRADLAALGAPPAPPGALPGPPLPLDATAVLYLLLGASLGLRVLRRSWAEGADAAAAGAGRFLRLDPPPGAWRALCADLALRPAEGEAADRTVRDARALFAAHLEAAARLPSPAPPRRGAA